MRPRCSPAPNCLCITNDIQYIGTPVFYRPPLILILSFQMRSALFNGSLLSLQHLCIRRFKERKVNIQNKMPPVYFFFTILFITDTTFLYISFLYFAPTMSGIKRNATKVIRENTVSLMILPPTVLGKTYRHTRYAGM